MPDPKPADKTKVEAPKAASPNLTPAGESSNPVVQQLLAELATARANGATDDVNDLVAYLGELGYTAG